MNHREFCIAVWRIMLRGGKPTRISASKAYKEFASSLGTTVDKLTQDEKRVALLNSVCLENSLCIE